MRTLRKITALLLAAVTTFSVLTMVSCSSSRYSLSEITLDASETSWSNPGEEYAGLLGQYGGTACPGTMVVATDNDIVYMYCEDAVEKDGNTRVSQNTVYDVACLIDDKVCHKTDFSTSKPL